MNFNQYDYINRNVSSEMFYSLMAILHEKLPCATNFFRLRKQFREKIQNENGSPIRLIASPKMMRGLSVTKKARNQQLSERASSPHQNCGTPDIRIRNYKNDLNSRRQSVNSAHNQMTNFGSAG